MRLPGKEGGRCDVALTDDEVEQFVLDGFVKIEAAFSPALAAECLNILWRDTGCDPDDPTTWTEPVMRLGDYAQEPFKLAANTPSLLDAFDQLVGAGAWVPRRSLGTVPVRFPHPADPGDAGWHIDASYTLDGQPWPPYVNVFSRRRALLMLFLFSDVGELDAPTRIRVGSHLATPSRLLPAGERGLSFLEVGDTGLFDVTANLPRALATGKPGDVYLCHPFLVHAAQPHRGSNPRFMAQPPLYLSAPLQLERADDAYSPVERAIRLGLDADYTPATTGPM
jgi:hypothetical protein